MKIDLSEHSGRGVSTILEKYDSSVFDFEGKSSFTVSIPFNPLAYEDKETNIFTESAQKSAQKSISIIMIVNH